MIDAIQNVLITRTLRNTEEFIEFRTGNAGGWSSDETQAYRFGENSADRELAELRRGSESRDYIYDMTTVSGK